MNRFPVAAVLVFCLVSVARADIAEGTFLGPALRWQPVYDGSSVQTVQTIPVVRYMGSLLFVRSTADWLEAGLRRSLGDNTHAGLQLALEPGRNPAEAPPLRQWQGTGLNRAVSVGAHLEWDHQLGPMPVSALVRFRQRLGQNRGLQIDSRFEAGLLQWGPLGVGAYVDATWANASATQLLYGTPPDPATRLPFRPGAGWLYGNTGLGMGLDLSRHWSLVGGLERHYLASPVDLSPLVQQRQNTYWTAGVLYVY